MTTPTLTQKVLLVGDTHGNTTALRHAFYDAQQVGATTIIQLGDFGFGWSMGEDGLCDFSVIAHDLAQRGGIDFYWLDGNHENFDELYKLPIDPQTGLRPVLGRVTHLPRGSTLKVGNTTFRAFGGACSVDKGYRHEGTSWWKQETITDAELEFALRQPTVDVFLSHDAPEGVQDVENLTIKLTQWGTEAAHNSIANQKRVRKALDASGATKAFHGHLHQRYEFTLDNGVVVTGINRDETDTNTYVLEV